MASIPKRCMCGFPPETTEWPQPSERGTGGYMARWISTKNDVASVSGVEVPVILSRYIGATCSFSAPFCFCCVFSSHPARCEAQDVAQITRKRVRRSLLLRFRPLPHPFVAPGATFAWLRPCVAWSSKALPFNHTPAVNDTCHRYLVRHEDHPRTVWHVGGVLPKARVRITVLWWVVAHPAARPGNNTVPSPFKEAVIG